MILRRHFLTGLFVIVPAWGTYLILSAIFGSLDGVLGPFLKAQGIYYLPGMGFFALVLLILSVGISVSNIVGRRLLALWERVLQRLPVVRNVYSLAKSIVDAFALQAEGSEKFRRVVLIEYPRAGAHTIGFVTGEMQGDRHLLAQEKIINVFVPTVPNPTSGFLLLVPESKVIPVTLSVEEAMKMAVSCGLYNPTLTAQPQSTPLPATDPYVADPRTGHYL